MSEQKSQSCSGGGLTWMHARRVGFPQPDSIHTLRRAAEEFRASRESPKQEGKPVTIADYSIPTITASLMVDIELARGTSNVGVPTPPPIVQQALAGSMMMPPQPARTRCAVQPDVLNVLYCQALRDLASGCDARTILTDFYVAVMRIKDVEAHALAGLRTANAVLAARVAELEAIVAKGDVKPAPKPAMPLNALQPRGRNLNWIT